MLIGHLDTLYAYLVLNLRTTHRVSVILKNAHTYERININININDVFISNRTV